jgi:exosome complex component RRP41
LYLLCLLLNKLLLMLHAFGCAGIPMRDMVASCAAGYLQGQPLLDLNYLEDSAGGPDIAVALQPLSGKLVLLQMDSRLPLENFDACVQLAVEGCKAVAGQMRKALLKHTQNLAIATGAARPS